MIDGENVESCLQRGRDQKIRLEPTAKTGFPVCEILGRDSRLAHDELLDGARKLVVSR